MGMHLPKELERKVLEMATNPPPQPPVVKKRPPPLVTRTTAVRFTCPVVIRSEANLGGKLRGKLGRKNQLKAAVNAALAGLFITKPLPPYPGSVTVTLTRLAVRQLDDDNLKAALKPARDVIAGWLGKDDADPVVEWQYRQRPAWAVGLEVNVTIKEHE